ncbi:hypothetical protein DPMN_162605 [Dreissena polymorpha]|uniref:Uncharacterized protein n=1 Tax=Dreissena polymorpha TaxID=45954 RepID=A0A9D4ITW0_DREPO|nr:hypothetical protein DPMN_162605 [Dreissena polymorpha]
MSSWNAEPARHSKKNCTTLYPNIELNVELECRASSTFENKHTTLYANAELNFELECRASSTFENKHTTLYANVELNIELECRASSTFGNLNVELMSNVERRANFTHLRYSVLTNLGTMRNNRYRCCGKTVLNTFA